MTVLFTACSFVLGGKIFGQESDTTDFNYDPSDRSFLSGMLSGHRSWDIHAGNFYYDVIDLNNHLRKKHGNTIDDYSATIGFSFKQIFHINTRSRFDGHVSYQFLIPQIYHFSDSLSMRIQGYHLGLDLGKDLFPQNKAFDLLLCIGLNTGRLKFQCKDQLIADKYLKYTNPFFAPKILIEPKVVIKKISFSIRAEYLVDISNSNWNIKDSRLPVIGTAKSSGLLLQGSLGFIY